MPDFADVNEIIKAIWPDWDVVDYIGSGAYGDVFLAVRGGFAPREAAVKIIPIPQDEGDSFDVIPLQMRNEYEETARGVLSVLQNLEGLNNTPNIVNIEDYSILPSGNGYGWNIVIRMECLKPISALASISDSEIIRLGIDICSALEACARKNLLHLDIKPTNVFVTPSGAYKLADTGISCVLDTAFEGYSDSESLGFMAPELMRGENVDARADVYSLGILLRYLLGRAAAVGANGTSKAREVNPELDEIINKACEVLPEKRYRSAAQMKNALMTAFAAKCFDGVKTTTADTAKSEDEIFAFNSATGGIEDVSVGDTIDFNIPSETADTEYINPFNFDFDTDVVSGNVTDADGEYVYDDSGDEDARAAAIEAGAAVTAAAKTARDSRRAPWSANLEDGEKKGNIIGIIAATVAVLIFIGLAIFAVSMISDIVGTPDDTTDDVQADVVEKIEIATPPENLVYVAGEKISTEGLEIRAIYASGEERIVNSGFTVSPERAKGAGTQKIKVYYDNFSVEYYVEVHPAKIESIAVSKMPEKEIFALGEDIDLTGFELELTYTDGATKAQTDGFTFAPDVAKQLGDQKIIVSYAGMTTSFNVTVAEKVGDEIAIISLPEKLDYIIGEPIDMEGLVLDVMDENGERKRVSSGFAITPAVFDRAGKQTVNVTYGSRSIDFEVNVGGVALESITVLTMPDKTVYTVGDKLDMKGFSLTANYNDGTSRVITRGYTYSPPTLKKAGNRHVTVTYGDKYVVIYVTVNEAAPEAAVQSISVALKPTKLSYMLGDTLDTSGLTLAVQYTDGTLKNVTEGFTCSPTVLNTAGDIPVTVTLDGFSTSFTVSVKAPAVDSGTLDGGLEWSVAGGVLTVSGTGRMPDFTDKGAPWSKYEDNISSIVVKSGVTYIGKYAFAHVMASSISIPETALEIDKTAMYNCLGLVNISVADGNTSYAVVEGVLTSFDKKRLYVYPLGRESTTFTLPDSIEFIEGYRIFCNSRITRFVITDNLYSIDPTAFEGARRLESFEVRNKNVAFSSLDGVLYTKNKNALVYYPMGRTAAEFVVPEGVGVIREAAFSFNPKLATITLPSTLYRVDQYAFYNIPTLGSVVYEGDEASWSKVEIGEGNASLTGATITFKNAE